MVRNMLFTSFPCLKAAEVYCPGLLGASFQPSCCWWSYDCSCGDRVAQTNCGLVPCSPHITCPLLFSQWLCSESDHELIHLVMIMYGEGECFQEGFLYSKLVFLRERRRECEEGVSAGQLIGHCCQSSAVSLQPERWHLLISGGIPATSREPEKATRVDCNY